MYLTEFAQPFEPLDIAGTVYFADALGTAVDLGGTPQPPFAGISRNLLVQGLRLHMTDWGRLRQIRKPAALVQTVDRFVAGV